MWYTNHGSKSSAESELTRPSHSRNNGFRSETDTLLHPCNRGQELATNLGRFELNRLISMKLRVTRW